MLGRTTSLVLFLYFLSLVQATCKNYYTCKPKLCRVRAETEYGCVCGKLRKAEDGTPYASFRGIPYGKPPIGAGRFKELEPVDPWGVELYDATEDSPACPQSCDFIRGRIPLQEKGMSEDCIYLGVHVRHKWLPRYSWKHEGCGRPVLVFIHGGAYQNGAGLSDEIGPEYMMTTDCVLITINYRINVFGFYSLNCKEIPGNQGFRDQVTALHWVQRNVRYFGGDPDNVTLMGLGAQTLSLSKAAKGLFHKIIIGVTALPTYYTTSPKHAADISRVFLEALRINHTDPVLIHRELIRTPLLKIMQANTLVQYRSAFSPFCPTVETKQYPGITRVLEDNPLTLIAQGRGSEYPMMYGFRDNEMAFARWMVYKKSILPMISKKPSGVVSPRLAYSLPDSEIKKITEIIFKRYFKGVSPTVDEALRYMTDMFFKYPALVVARWRALCGGAPLYLYKFAYSVRMSPLKRAHWVDYSGAAHMDDLHCIFRVNSLMGDRRSFPPRDSDDYMVHSTVSAVYNFMTCSKPSCRNATHWPPVSIKYLRYNHITAPFCNNMQEPTKEEKAIVDFFTSFDPEVRKVTAILSGH